MTGAVVQRMRELPMPVIAAVNGVAAGRGAVIALAADLRVVAESAPFTFLFTKVGLAGADMGSAYLLPRVVGLGSGHRTAPAGRPGRRGRRPDGSAWRTGVVDDGISARRPRSWPRRLASGPTLAHATTKLLLTRELDMGLNGALELEAFAQALLMTSEDHAEFFRAFTAKREPEWTGR